ncbi:hypothetical protein D3C77_427010 [compost metagenome]
MSIFNEVVSDAGTGMLPLNAQKWGRWGEIYPCHTHTGSNCSTCGGTGYRSICNRTDCHEHGCQGGACSSTKEQFAAQQSRIK